MVEKQGGVSDRAMSSKGYGGIRQRAGVTRAGSARAGPPVAAVRRQQVRTIPHTLLTVACTAP